MKTSYIPKGKRKKILLLGDDLRMHSGVATMLRETVLNSSNHFNWIQLAGAIKHPDKGKKFDLSEETNKHYDVDDSEIFVIPVDGYGDAQLIRDAIPLLQGKGWHTSANTDKLVRKALFPPMLTI